MVEDDGSDGGTGQDSGSDVEFTRRKKKLTRLRRTHDEGGILDDDDLALLQETHAQNEGVEHGYDQQAALRALNARDLESQLFSGPPGDEEGDHGELGGSAAAPNHKPFREEDYQSEEEEDFIEHDIAMYSDDKLRKAVSFDAGDYMQVGGPTPDQLLEAMEIFGEGIVEHLKGQQPSITTLHEEGDRFPAAPASAVPRVEPGKLQESFVSPEDKIIQSKDWSERLQPRLALSCRDDEVVVRPEAAADKWKKESMWIFSEMKDILKIKAKPPPPTAVNDVGWGNGGDSVEETGWGNAAAAATSGSTDSREQKIIRIIESVLVLVRVEGMEIPFIFNHRPDSFKPELDLVHLWRIYDLDEKWESLTLRRQNISRVANTLWNKAETDEKVAVDDAALLSSTMGNDMRKEYGTEKALLPILKDTLTLFPKELYGKLAVESDDETFLRDLQAYLSLVTLRYVIASHMRLS